MGWIHVASPFAARNGYPRFLIIIRKSSRSLEREKGKSRRHLENTKLINLDTAIRTQRAPKQRTRLQPVVAVLGGGVSKSESCDCDATSRKRWATILRKPLNFFPPIVTVLVNACVRRVVSTDDGNFFLRRTRTEAGMREFLSYTLAAVWPRTNGYSASSLTFTNAEHTPVDYFSPTYVTAALT